MLVAYDGSDVEVYSLEDGGRAYVINGRRYYSVTTVLARCYPLIYNQVPAKILGYAQDVGTEVHKVIAHYSRTGDDVLGTWEMDPAVKPRVECFAQWEAEAQWAATYVEATFYDPVLGIAGTPDQVGIKTPDPKRWISIVDFKPKVALLASLQLQGYSMLVRQCLGLTYSPKRFSVHLHDWPKPAREKEHELNRTDRDAFLACVTVHNMGLRLGVYS